MVMVTLPAETAWAFLGNVGGVLVFPVGIVMRETLLDSYLTYEIVSEVVTLEVKVVTVPTFSVKVVGFKITEQLGT